MEKPTREIKSSKKLCSLKERSALGETFRTSFHAVYHKHSFTSPLVNFFQKDELLYKGKKSKQELYNVMQKKTSSRKFDKHNIFKKLYFEYKVQQ